MPTEIQTHVTLDAAMREAVINTFQELPSVEYASAVNWYATLTFVISTLRCYQGIPELCVQMLTQIAKEIEKRRDPHSAILATRLIKLLICIDIHKI